ncbi:MAG: PQQ-dependent sugar dehydrogenase [Planctomycetota bacterium]|nr:PQQ-dependent sugar dehydrogenase [Planctomycetota bacterium]
MNLIRNRASLAASVLGLLVTTGTALALPPGFVDESVSASWNQAVGVSFGPDGTGYVWEKGGRVWTVRNGVKSATPLVDISQEVGDWRDFGLLGFCLDPNFATNRRIYLLYVVDYHHARYFGTPQYVPTVNEYFRDTIGRLTRYTVNAAGTGVEPSSRQVLVGSSLTNGFPVCHQSHSIGTVLFGEDGSLLVGNGDGASYEEVDNGGPRNGSSNTARAEGIITAAEDVGAFRSLLLSSLNGKILRLDPETGNGLPDNPFYDPGAPASAASRTWAMGFRNPFRWTLRPGSGGTHGPGTLYVGDVGWYQREELNIVREGGKNFGWPLFEGLDWSGVGYVPAAPPNRTAPNPLFGFAGCTQQFFDFQDLIVQDTLNTPSWPNPCNASVQVPPTIARFEHTRPAIEWGHGGAVRVGIYNAQGQAVSVAHDAPNSPVRAFQFDGSSSTGGVWATGSAFPAPFGGSYFHADFTGGWIHQFQFDAADQLQEVRRFQDSAGAVVAVAWKESDALGAAGLHYINYDNQGVATLRRIRFAGDLPPVVVASATPQFGPTPLQVQFSSAGSRDPEGGALRYEWDFGDGSPVSTQANPVHTYSGSQDLTSRGSIIAKVYTLNPPGPQGGGSRNPEIIRDAVLPTPGTLDSQLQFDTFHFGDQGNEDWIGYTFATPQTVVGLTFQEGIHFFDGGWFDTLRVASRGIDGIWRNVPNVTITPAYAGNNGLSFETYQISFPGIQSLGVMIIGNPGGSANFISVGELRVRGLASSGAPTRRDVTLRVFDGSNNLTTERLIVSTDNTPPQVTITSPVDGSLYQPGGVDFTQQLRATVSDAEHGPSQLQCRWQVIFHHNDHTHPEPPVPACSTDVRVTPYGCDGEEYWYEFRLSVTDDAGLTTTRSTFIYPNCCPADFNRDRQLDFFDYLDFAEAFATEEDSADFNNSGQVDFFDYLDYAQAFSAGC